ncbi:MAG: HAD family phosphatase [Lachnospiraceae bacterium]|nr:HAD family phosphatase [Lachnospiraceae bacterium]
MIKNIVFDIGNVLVNFAWQDYFHGLGIEGETFDKVVKATVRSSVWNEVDRGVKSDDELLRAFIDNDPSVEDAINKVFENIHDMLIQFEYAKGWIIDLQRKGYKVYCLSNMSYKATRDCADALDFLPMLDGYILSCDVKTCKPEPEIYKALFDKYSLKPEECIFIDDLSANINAAKEMGMHGIVFKDLKTATSEIERIVAENAGEFKSKYSKTQRVAALVTVILIVALYLANLILAFINTDAARKMLRATLGLTIGLPILAWIYIWMIGKLTHKDTIADFHFFEDKTK